MAAQLKNTDPGSFPELITLSYTHEGSTDEKYFRTVERACNLSSIHLQLEEFPFAAANRVGGAAPAWWEPRFRETARLMENLGSSVYMTGQLGDFIMGNRQVALELCVAGVELGQGLLYCQAVLVGPEGGIGMA